MRANDLPLVEYVNSTFPKSLARHFTVSLIGTIALGLWATEVGVIRSG